ncbi:MAG: DHH family phosphoesterase [Clostridium sp.]
MTAIRLFSHTDLDGYGCNIVMEALVSQSRVITTNINYEENNEIIKNYILSGEYKDYRCTFITDISVNEEVAELIDKTKDLKLVLLDHHPTAEWLNKYDWANVCVNNCFEKTSGTELLFNFLVSSDGCVEDWNYFREIHDFVKQVKRYDTWLWKEKYNDDTPKKLNDLFYILGYDKFYSSLKENNFNVKFLIHDYSYLLENQQKKIDKYIEKKNKEIIGCPIKDYNVGVVFANQYQSELGNRLSELNSQYDLIAMIGENTISYRTIKEDVDCGEFAKLFNGGGHPKAAGSEINEEQKNKIIDLLFDKGLEGN